VIEKSIQLLALSYKLCLPPASAAFLFDFFGPKDEAVGSSETSGFL
jgi:hypothetical protein